MAKSRTRKDTGKEGAQMSSTESRVVLERLQSAVDRIVSNKPTDEALRHLASQSKLRLSVSNVAREAGCSRTLIGFDGCAYPSIRKQIQEAKSQSAKRTLKDAIRDLREEVSLLEKEIEARDTAYAELLIRVSEAAAGRQPSGRPITPSTRTQRTNGLQIVGRSGRDG